MRLSLARKRRIATYIKGRAGETDRDASIKKELAETWEEGKGGRPRKWHGRTRGSYEAVYLSGLNLRPT